jgi:hypothetical protein
MGVPKWLLVQLALVSFHPRKEFTFAPVIPGFQFTTIFYMVSDIKYQVVTTKRTNGIKTKSGDPQDPEEY